MSEILGLWDTSWPKQGTDFPRCIKKREIGHFKASERVVNYLKAGCSILARRTLLVSIYDNEVIGFPELICDNLFIWSSEYAFYVGKGLIEIDQLLLENMHANDFEIPDLVLSDLEVLNKLLLKSSFPKLPNLPRCL